MLHEVTLAALGVTLPRNFDAVSLLYEAAHHFSFAEDAAMQQSPSIWRAQCRDRSDEFGSLRRERTRDHAA